MPVSYTHLDVYKRQAHNLVDRGREMYSAHVDRADVLEAKRLAGDYSKGLVRALEKVNRQLRILEKECTEYEILPNPGADVYKRQVNIRQYQRLKREALFLI